MSEFKAGDRVVYLGDKNNEMPQFYPRRGTIGIVQPIKDEDEDFVWVQWPNGSTSKDDVWVTVSENLTLAIEVVQTGGCGNCGYELQYAIDAMSMVMGHEHDGEKFRYCPVCGNDCFPERDYV